jgi:hypothetical protein
MHCLSGIHEHDFRTAQYVTAHDRLSLVVPRSALDRPQRERDKIVSIVAIIRQVPRRPAGYAGGLVSVVA